MTSQFVMGENDVTVNTYYKMHLYKIKTS